MNSHSRNITPAPALRDILAHVPVITAELGEGAAERDLSRELPFFAFDRIRQAGIGTVRVPRRLGGPGGSIGDVIEAIATLASGEPNVAHSLRSHFNYTEMLFLGPDSPERERTVKRLLEGALFGGAHTETGTPRPGD